MTRRRVAIIGAGFSGVAVAAQLVRRGRNAPDVVLIERGPRFGYGVAYGPKNKDYLLNVRAANMSAFPDKPEHFARWLKAHGGAAPTAFAPRAKYGAYAESILRHAEGARMFGKAIRRVRDEAVSCAKSGEGWSIALASGKSIEADAVVLAIGHRPPAVLPPLEASGAPIISAWDADAIKRLPRGDVLLVGAGLTMVDVALSLAARKHKGTIYALSRRGLIPRAHLSPPRPPVEGGIDLPENLSDAVLAFRREVQAMAERGEPWQLAIDRLRKDTPALWRRLPPETQRRFLRHLRPWWDVHRHRAAPEIAARIADLQAEGQLRVLAGEIVQATRQDRGIIVEYRRRGGTTKRQLDVAGIVNCTGGDLDLTRAQDALPQQLLASGIARPSANGLGFDLDADARVLNADGAPHANLFAIGPLTQGAFWESTAVPEIRQHAAAIALLL